MKNNALTAITLACSLFSNTLFASAAPHDFTRLHTQLSEQIQELKVPGAQVAVFDQQQVLWQHSYGFTDAEQQSAVSADTLFRAGSTTKTFIALAIMQLVNQGKFALQDEVLRLEPRLKIQNPWHSSTPVRVIHLLEHTAGLDDMHFRNFYNVSEPDISMLDAVNRDAASLRVRWQPGTRHAYSNPGYGILGHLIEKYTRQPFEHYIAEQVLAPLGLQQCQLNSAFVAEPNLSQGFVDGTAVPFRQIYLRAAGNLHCTAAGLAKLGTWLLSVGQSADLPYLNSNTITLMEQPESTLAAQQGLSYGYAKAIYHATRSGRQWLGHNGGIDGFITSYGYNRQLQLGYAIMVNSSSVSMKTLLDTLTSFLAHDAPQQAPTVLPVDIADINGYYRVSNERNQIFAGLGFSAGVAKVSTSAHTLLVDPLLGASIEYHYLGNGQFAKAGESHAKVVVIGNTDDGFAIDLDGDYLLKTSAIGAWLPIIMLGFIFSVFLLTLCYAPIWIINTLRGKLSARQQVWLRLLPLLNVACLATVVYALFNLSMFATSQLNWQTLTIYLGSIAFAISSIATTCLVLRQRHAEPSRPARYFALTSAVSANLFALYCFYFDYLGLALWQW